MDFLNLISAKPVEGTGTYVPVTLDPAKLATPQVLSVHRHTFLGLNIAHANRLAKAERYVMMVDGKALPIHFSHITEDGIMVFNKPLSFKTGRNKLVKPGPDKPATN